MSEELKMISRIYILACLITSTRSQYESMGLNSVPPGIPPSSTSLSFQDNNISYVHPETFKDFHSLTFLSFRENSFQTFPNLSHISDTLIELRLGQNLLETIPPGAFDDYAVLQILKLNRNRLIALPDLTALGDTLQDLSVMDNRLCSIPDFQPSNPGNLVIRAKGNSIDACDCGNQWLLDLRNAGHRVFFDDARTDCPGSRQQAEICTVHSSETPCPSTCPALSTLPARSMIACFGACSIVGDCRYFSFSPNTSSCTVRTSGTAVQPDFSADDGLWKHYVVT